MGHSMKKTIILILLLMTQNSYGKSVFERSLPLQYTENYQWGCYDKLNKKLPLDKVYQEIKNRKKKIILVHGYSLEHAFNTHNEMFKYYESEWSNYIKYFNSKDDSLVCLYNWEVRSGIPYFGEDNSLGNLILALRDRQSNDSLTIIAHSQGGNYAKTSLVKIFGEVAKIKGSASLICAKEET